MKKMIINALAYCARTLLFKLCLACSLIVTLIVAYFAFGWENFVAINAVVVLTSIVIVEAILAFVWLFVKDKYSTRKCILVTNIIWDAPEDVAEELPQSFEIIITAENEYMLEDINEDAIAVSDFITDETGWCHKGFCTEVVEVSNAN